MKDKLKETIPLQIWIIVALVVLVAGGFFAWQKYGVIVKIKNLEIVPSQIIGDSTVYREGAKAIVIGKNLGKVELYQRGGGTEIYTSPEGGFLGAGLKTKTIKGEEKWEIMSLPTERLMKELCAVGFDKKGNKIGDVCLFDVYGEPTGVSGETADWQIYRNEEYGFGFRYPENFGANVWSPHFWPPRATVVSLDEDPVERGCPDFPVGIQGAIKNKIKINNIDYSLYEVSEGAAGTSYTNYCYTTKKDQNYYVLYFVIRSATGCGGGCGAYCGTPYETECSNLNRVEDIEKPIEKMLSTFRFFLE